MDFSSTRFNDIYTSLVKYVLENGSEVTVRGNTTIECLNISLLLKDINDYEIDFSSTMLHDRETKYQEYLKDEPKWYESGCLVASHAPAKFWQKIADPDGRIQSNYGYIILHDKKNYTTNGETSFNHVIKQLKEDIYSRQAILHYNLPSHYNTQSNDIPCTVAAQV